MKRLKILLQSNQFYLFFFLFLSFYVLFFTKIIKYPTKYPDTTKEIIGKIVSYSIDGDKLSLIIKGKEKISAIYYMQSEEEKKELINTLKIGLKLKLIGEKKEILGKTIPNTFDYKSYLYHEKIYFCFTISKIEILDNSIGVLNLIKNKLEERIKKIGNNAYLRAFVLGDKTLMDNEEYENIKKNGVSHLFALSGMHLSLLYLFLDKILRKFKYKKGIIYLILLLYLYCTGCSISFSRAILFLFLLDGSKKWNLQISKIKILFLTAFLLLLFNPFTIYNVGFWYTFVVTFSLLFCNRFLSNKKKIMQVVFVSVITFLFSLPISIYLNYEINLLSIFNNILLVPFISTFIFPLALLSFLVPIFLPIFQFFIQILEKLNFLLASIEIPIVFGKISLLEVCICYLFLILGFLLKYKKIFVFLFLFLILLYNKNLFQKNYSVYFLDVGQGDATLFVAPKNKEVILIDTGGSIKTPKKEYQKRNKEFDLADNIVLFLKSNRIRKIDLLLITHGDKDHLGYASKIKKEIVIKEIMINKGTINEAEQELIKGLKKTKKYNARQFDFQTFSLKDYGNENDNSILTKIKIFDKTFLLMGDASSKVEKDFLSQYSITSTILKVGHHGSNTSSSLSFLKKVNPKYAVISAGRNNLYHHPSKETTKNLDSLKILILNTQEMGTIEMQINKNKFQLLKTLA